MLKLFARITLSCVFLCTSLAAGADEISENSSLYNHNVKADDLKVIRKYGCKISKIDKIRKKISIHYANTDGLKLKKVDGDTIITVPDCYFKTKDWVLFDKSIIEPKVKIAPYKERDDSSYRCSVIGGRWIIINDKNGKYVMEEDVRKIQVDHILPFSYIALNMENCNRTGEYYNYLENITLVLRDENEDEDDYLCRTDEECWQQTKICRNMADYFDDDVLCYKLFMDFKRKVKTGK